MGKPGWELGRWKDGTKRLVYWDYMAGDDIVIILLPDGTAAIETTNEDDTETRTPIDNLVTYLIELEAKFWKAARK